MNKFILTICSFFSVASMATTINASSGSTYLGKEFVNQQATGNTCVVLINHVLNFSEKGNACKKVALSYFFHGEEIGKEGNVGILQSLITNHQTNEFKNNNLKTCAEPIVLENGKKAEANIYDDNEESLYNPIFHGGYSIGQTEYSHFLDLNASDKTPTRAAINVVATDYTRLYECVDLVDATPIQ